MGQTARQIRTPDGQTGIEYYDENGNLLRTQVGGAPAWRNNNPGNLVAGKGMIGTDAGGFAIFPDLQTGLQARADLLRNDPRYQGKTIREMIPIYAPAKENDVPAYTRNIAAFSGLDMDKKISDLTDEEFQRLTQAISRREGAIDKHGNPINVGTTIPGPAGTTSSAPPDTPPPDSQADTADGDGDTDQTADASPPPPAPTGDDIAAAARDVLGSGSWRTNAVNSPFGAGVQKDHQFVADTLDQAGLGFDGNPAKIPTAAQWADPDADIPGWTVVDGPPQAGDVLATPKGDTSQGWYIRPGQQMGIATGDGTTIGINANEKVTESSWGLDPDGDQPTIRRSASLIGDGSGADAADDAGSGPATAAAANDDDDGSDDDLSAWG